MNQNQLLVYKPNFLVFNYSGLELEYIRKSLYESYEMIIEFEDIPSMEELMNDDLPIDTVYNQIISEIAFDSIDEWEWLIPEETDVYLATFNAHSWKVTHDLSEILLMDRMFFMSEENLPNNYPTVKVW